MVEWLIFGGGVLVGSIATGILIISFDAMRDRRDQADVIKTAHHYLTKNRTWH